MGTCLSPLIQSQSFWINSQLLPKEIGKCWLDMPEEIWFLMLRSALNHKHTRQFKGTNNVQKYTIKDPSAFEACAILLS